MRATPIAKRLERVHPDAARVSRIAFDARFGRLLEATCGAGAKVLRRQPPRDAMVLELAAGDGLLRVGLDTREWPALEMALALEDEADACAVASVLMTPWLAMLGRMLPAPRVVRRRRSTAAGRALPCPTIATPAVQVALVHMGQAPHDAIRRGLAGIECNAQDALAALRLRPRLILLRRVMPAPTLAALQAGDVVLLDGTHRQSRVLVLTFGKGMTMQVDTALDPDSGQITATGEPTMEAEDSGPDDAATLDELQVPVSFEVDSALVTLAELASIQPGYVIELERPLDAATVRLVCHGQTVGHGQLVAVGEQMGIRIVRMGLGRAPGSGS